MGGWKNDEAAGLSVFFYVLGGGGVADRGVTDKKDAALPRLAL